MNQAKLENRENVMKHLIQAIVCALIVLFIAACSASEDTSTNGESVAQETVSNAYEQEAMEKLVVLKGMMDRARANDIDVAREETIVWFSEQFLKFANWDEANPEAVAALFGYERYYTADKDKLAAELPDFERKKVIQILDRGIEELEKELRGDITRRPVQKIDWHNTRAGDNMFVANGKPSFPYDYFSKSVGQPLTNTDVYNDHLGALYHGGENLYPVDHDRAINSFLLKEDGTFDEELMKELTGIPDTNIGFLIYWLMGIPEWVEEAEPEVRKGRSLFTGFDIDNPLAREVWGKIIRRTGELTKGKKVTELGYILANEPHWYSEKGHWTHQFLEMNSISSYTLEKFRNWLDSKYDGDIAALNANWDSAFEGFDTIDIEIPMDTALRGKPIWFDWNRFGMDRATDWFTFMQTELHAVNPDADTHIKIFPRTFTEDSRSHGIDVEALTELTTMIGHDAKALGSPSIRPHISSEWHEKYAYYWSGMSRLHDFLESVAPDKINVNSESHFLSSGMWRDMDPRTSYVRNVYWLATLQGMDANMGWFWARDPDGSPEDRLEGELDFFDPGLGGAFAGSNNMQPHVTNEVTQVMYDLNSFSEEIIALRDQRRPLRLFYSETTAINIPDYMTKGKKLYESLFFEGFPLGFVTKNILEKQDHSNWDAIVVFRSKFVTDAEFTSIQSYLDQGGTVVIDADSLTLNEYGDERAQALTAGEGKLVVLEPGATIAAIQEAALAEVADSSKPDIVITENNGQSHKTIHWRSVRQPDDSYLVNLLNLGHDSAKVRLAMEDGQSFAITDLMTGNPLDPEFDLESEGVLLLELRRR